MEHAEHSEALRSSKPLEEAHDVFGGFRIEACNRLVGQQHPRPLRQRAGDCDALRLATRQRTGPLRSEIGKADVAEIAARRGELALRQTAEHSAQRGMSRSEEHTSELQSRRDLVCR